MAAQQLLEQKSKEAAESIRSMGRVAESIGRLDTGVVADGMESLASKVPLAGESFVAFSQSVRAVLGGLDETARHLSAFSAPLAEAQALANVTRVTGDIRRAEILGPDLAQYTNARSAAEDALKDALATMLKEAMPSIVMSLEIIATWARGAANMTAIISEMKDTVLATIQATPWGDRVLDILQQLRQISANTEKDRKPSSQHLEQVLLNLFAGHGGAQGMGDDDVVDPARVGPARALRVEGQPFNF